MAELFKECQFVRELGKGAFGSVCLYKKPSNLDKPEQLVAVKTVDIKNARSLALFHIEIDNLQILSKDPNCYKYISCYIDSYVESMKILPTKGYIIMEYIKGLPLDKHLQERRIFLLKNEFYDHVYELLKDLVTALAYMHNFNIMHADIKPDNIMVTYSRGQAYPVLIDFGLSCTMKDTCTEMRGAPLYRDPSSFLTLKSDLWSLGISMFSSIHGGVFTGFKYNPDILKTQKVNHIIRLERFTTYVKEHVPVSKTGHIQLDKTLNSMMNLDPDKRPTALEILATWV